MSEPTREREDSGLSLLTTCPTRDEALQIRYALQLRKIECRVSEPPGFALGAKRGEFRLFVPRASLQRAQEALPYIAGAMFGESLALDPEGRCALCGYDMTGVTHTTICPECGEDLASIGAKRRARWRT